MTSYPASASARATTLAPRSCPSSPAFATRMRSLRFTPEILSDSRGRSTYSPSTSRRLTLASFDRRLVLLAQGNAAAQIRGRHRHQVVGIAITQPRRLHRPGAEERRRGLADTLPLVAQRGGEAPGDVEEPA